LSASRMRTDDARRLSRRSGEAAKADLLQRERVGPTVQFRGASAQSRSKHLRTRLSRFSISRENPHGPFRASAISMHGFEKRIVYIIRSDIDPSRHYVGITNDLRARLEWHNHGPSGHTRSHRPWSVVVSLEFPTEKEAVRFEKYLKSGSGRAFSTRHFGPE